MMGLDLKADMHVKERRTGGRGMVLRCVPSVDGRSARALPNRRRAVVAFERARVVRSLVGVRGCLAW